MMLDALNSTESMGFLRRTASLHRGLALIAVLLCDIAEVRATMIAVTTTSDDVTVNGNCSLREAVMAANTDTAVDGCPAGSGADTITVPSGMYVLSLAGAGEDAAATGDLDLTADVTVTGAGANATAVTGPGSDRIFDVGPATPGIVVGISAMTIANGGGVNRGGGLRNHANLTLSDCRLQGNIAVHSSDARGGGLFSDGMATIAGCKIIDNRALGGVFGRGGGVANSGTMEIGDTTLRENLARSTGTGVGIGHATATGGGVQNTGTLTIRSTTVNDNDALLVPSVPLDEGPSAIGGGIANGDPGFFFFGTPPTSGTLALTNSTISGNRAVAGGVYTAVSGGGLLSVGDVTIGNATIDGNTILGPPLFSGGPDVLISKPSAIASSATFRNSIVTECGATGTPTLVADDYNIAAEADCGFMGTDQIGVDPLLGPLAANGGPTFTRALLAGSPALEGANPALPGSGGGACESDDQRGVARPQSSRCDTGAFEATPCGDGVIDAAEQCDDGNTAGGDGCSAGCSIETCWGCAGAPSVCAPTTGMPCDDADACTSGDLCSSGGACVSGTLVCPLCGNGVINFGEECDDGDNDIGDGCGACLIETCYACSGEPSVCAPDVGATCDDGDPCTSGEACNASAVCVGGSDVCPLDHYKCYLGKDLDNPPFAELDSVFLSDQLSTFSYGESVRVTKLKYVCTPVDKNGEGITNPSGHLSCYQIRAEDLSPYDVRYQVSTQFQTSQFRVKKGKLLCLPSSKTLLP